MADVLWCGAALAVFGVAAALWGLNWLTSADVLYQALLLAAVAGFLLGAVLAWLTRSCLRRWPPDELPARSIPNQVLLAAPAIGLIACLVRALWGGFNWIGIVNCIILGPLGALMIAVPLWCVFLVITGRLFGVLPILIVGPIGLLCLLAFVSPSFQTDVERPGHLWIGGLIAFNVLMLAIRLRQLKRGEDSSGGGPPPATHPSPLEPTPHRPSAWVARRP
jgi:hypothetical protein